MCNPGTSKSDEELALKLRHYLDVAKIAAEALVERGYSVQLSGGFSRCYAVPNNVKITKTTTTEVTL